VPRNSLATQFEPSAETTPGTGRVSRPLHLVHVAPQIASDSNGVGRAVYYLAQAQRALGQHVGTAGDRADVVRQLLDTRPDIVHLHSIHVLGNIALARHLRAAKVPYCVTIHGGLHNHRRGRMKKTALWWLGERHYLNHAMFIHALTSEEAKGIEAYGVRAPIVIAPNGIDVGALPRAANRMALVERAPELAGHRVFMFMGRVAPIQKGLDLLLHGLALANLPDWRLVILGFDFRGGRAALEAQADGLGVRWQTVFLGGESPERCADLMAGADVFVHTSRWEGMSLAVLESAGWRMPCLLTRAADPNGALGQAGGAVVVDSTPEAIAAGLREMATLEPDALLAMGQRAHDAVVTRFTWKQAATTLIDAYRYGRGLDRR
jgi:glycosyltransferase involved in cell wall biosynthesis